MVTVEVRGGFRIYLDNIISMISWCICFRSGRNKERRRQGKEVKIIHKAGCGGSYLQSQLLGRQRLRGLQFEVTLDKMLDSYCNK
jgi:hypothetical protein